LGLTGGSYLACPNGRAAIGSEAIEAVADRGYDSGEEILACVDADDVYLCPAGEPLTYSNTTLGVGGLREAIRA
jgi:hypothetical protein